ncbi:unnamed protein product [Rhodiola kirilowii]
MAIASSCSTSSSLTRLQSSLLPSFVPHNSPFPISTLKTRSHRGRCPIPLRVRAAATLESSNGAAVSKKRDDSNSDSYGRQFFPLAAVVGQDAIKTALLLGAIDREIGGIAISGREERRRQLWREGCMPFFHLLMLLLAQLQCRSIVSRRTSVLLPEGGKTDLAGKPGLLAEAHRGVLYVDEINLLDESISNLLLNVLTEGVNIVEREGISFRHPCKPLLIATYNPEEGSVREHLLDRIAINLSADLPLNFDDRVAAVGIATQFQERSKDVFKLVEEETDLAKTQIILAREYLKDVKVSREQLKYLVLEAIRGGCQGHRAELYAARVARCLAAVEGREKVTVDDLKKAVELVILPRSNINENPPDQQNQQPPPPTATPAESRFSRRAKDEEEKEDERRKTSNKKTKYRRRFIFDAEGGLVDEKLLFFAQQAQRRKGKAGRAKNVIFSEDRGRYIKPMLPKQLLHIRKLRREKDIQKTRKVFVEKTDMRAKRMARKAGALVIFVVDASGSMALNRMQNAKGAALKLLAESYTSRDQVSIIPFRGDLLKFYLPPSRSIAMARNRLERLLVWGEVHPLAHGLTTAVRVGLNAEKSGDVGRIMIVAITDGRANISLKRSTDPEAAAAADTPKPSSQELKDEILEVAGKIYKAGMSLLVIDTENKFVSTGFAKEIAESGSREVLLLAKCIRRCHLSGNKGCIVIIKELITYGCDQPQQQHSGADHYCRFIQAAVPAAKSVDTQSVLKRLQSELMALMMSGEAGISAFPEEDNIFTWKGTITGIKGHDYPFKPPKVKFETGCFHPIVDVYGNICLDILQDKWSSAYDVRTILISIQSLLGW